MKRAPAKPIRAVIVDDHAMLRKALRALLESEGRFATVGEAADAAEALGIIADTAPEIVIVDISLKGPANGLELTASLKSLHPSLKVLVLSFHAAAEFAQNARRAGADGYLSKSDAAVHLSAALTTILRGRQYGF